MKKKLLSFAALPLLAFGFLLTLERVSSTDTPKSPELKTGEQVYKVRCVACHMKDGNAPTKKMRLSDQEWKHGNSLDEVQKVVAEGVKGTVMIGFKNRLSKEEIKAVSAFVLTLSQPQAAATKK